MGMDPGDRERVRAEALHLVRMGGRARARVLGLLGEVLPPGRADTRDLEMVLNAALAVVRSESASWPTVTDCEVGEKVQPVFAAETVYVPAARPEIV